MELLLTSEKNYNFMTTENDIKICIKSYDLKRIYACVI